MVPEPGQIVVGQLFNEPMRVETAAQIDDGTWRLGFVGTHAERFRSVTLSPADLASLTAYRSAQSFQGEGTPFRLGVHSFCIAFEFDPYFGLSVSRVDPLPHQLEAIYHYIRKLPQIRESLCDCGCVFETPIRDLAGSVSACAMIYNFNRREASPSVALRADSGSA
jgi:hypothetical protein